MFVDRCKVAKFHYDASLETHYIRPSADPSGKAKWTINYLESNSGIWVELSHLDLQTCLCQCGQTLTDPYETRQELDLSWRADMRELLVAAFREWMAYLVERESVPAAHERRLHNAVIATSGRERGDLGLSSRRRALVSGAEEHPFAVLFCRRPEIEKRRGEVRRRRRWSREIVGA